MDSTTPLQIYLIEARLRVLMNEHDLDQDVDVRTRDEKEDELLSFLRIWPTLARRARRIFQRDLDLFFHVLGEQCVGIGQFAPSTWMNSSFACAQGACAHIATAREIEALIVAAYKRAIARLRYLLIKRLGAEFRHLRPSHLPRLPLRLRFRS